MKPISLILLLLLGSLPACVQVRQTAAPDPALLRGTITPERAWWDVLRYDITVEPRFEHRSITGTNTMRFKTVDAGQRMQIDLQGDMQLSGAEWHGQLLTVRREGNVRYLEFPQRLAAGITDSVVLRFAGTPRKAVNPPWDGGWIWKQDAQGRPWMSVAVQGLGASAWYPCKDHQSDEPQLGASLQVIVPDTLVAVANGRRAAPQALSGDRTAYNWSVNSPINNYNLVPYIGKYVGWSETFDGEAGKLDCTYWVLDYNLEKARVQFRQAPQTLRALEHWFGPYPFYRDGFQLVEAPHLGMEHQSAVAYGNRFANGYLGRDLSGSGWGLKWDFIIVHEMGHEWFGNNITSKDIADMWVHEGFTSYSETLFTEFYFGKAAADAYVQGIRKNIENDKPIIGTYGRNEEGSGDMYYKGANLLHTVRQLIGSDSLFRSILRGLNGEFRHSTVTTGQVEGYISARSGLDLGKVFDQYLRTNAVPVLQWKREGGQLTYRWTGTVPGFNMHLRLKEGVWLRPETEWKTHPWPPAAGDTLAVDPNFYIRTQRAE